MAKGSVRKKGKKWYYRFYVEDASGNLVQKEYAGTESKSETEKLLRQAMDDYESKKFIAKSENITVGELLDIWAEEELKTGTLSNGTVQNYLGAITNIKKHPISERKLKNVTSEHLQAFFDLLSFGGTYPDGSERKGYSKDYIRSFSAVLQQSFRFAVSPKQYITFNPMQYIKLKYQTDEVDLFSDDDMDGDIQPIPREDYERLIEFLQDYNPPAILPIQIAYYAGLRIGEACGLAWQDVNLEEQCLTIRRSIRYDGSRHKNIIGPTKRKKVRIVDFGDTLAEILRNARKEQLKNRMQYGELYHKNYYREVKDKNRVYYEFYHLDGTENVPEDYKEISFVCLRPDGSLELPSTLGIVCRKIAQKLDGFEGFHFHQLRHTYTSNLLANGAAPKDVQELLGHSDVSTTMNVYAHSTRKAKRNSARLLDKAKIAYELIPYEVDENDLSAVHVAASLGEDINCVFKTLILHGDKSGYFVCVIPGEHEVDLKLAAKASGNKKCDLIPVKELLPLTGYIRGGCSPIGMKKPFPTYIHETCLRFPYIYISAGQRGLQLKLDPKDLVREVHAEVCILFNE